MIGGMFILFLVLLLLNVPIAFSLGASSLFYLLTSNMNAAVLAQKFYAGIDSFTLLCIPGFMLAGALMNGGGITRRILNFCNAFLGHFTGSLALVNIVASMVFAGISGTAIADVCSLGGMLIPAMVEDGYDDDFSVAVTAASSVVGPIRYSSGLRGKGKILPGRSGSIFRGRNGLSTGFSEVGDSCRELHRASG